MRPRGGVVNGPQLASSFGVWGKGTRMLDERQCNKVVTRPAALSHDTRFYLAVIEKS
jgi:hypothetical protein